jgi:ferredoxin
MNLPMETVWNRVSRNDDRNHSGERGDDDARGGRTTPDDEHTERTTPDDEHGEQTRSGDEHGERATVTVFHDDEETEITATAGEPLRDVLLDAGLSPYTRVTERANCGGRGLCATCGVRLRSPSAPDHWHDRLAARFGYPRLSCQIPVEGGLKVSLVEEKLVWGGRE